MPPYNSTALANLIVQGGQRRGQQAGATRRALGQFVGGLGQQAADLTSQIMQDRREAPARKYQGLSRLMQDDLERQKARESILTSQASRENALTNIRLAEEGLQVSQDRLAIEQTGLEHSETAIMKSRLSSLAFGLARSSPETIDSMLPEFQEQVDILAALENQEGPMDFLGAAPGPKRKTLLQNFAYMHDPRLLPKNYNEAIIHGIPGTPEYDRLLRLEMEYGPGAGEKTTWQQVQVNYKDDNTGVITPSLEWRLLREDGLAYGGRGVEPLVVGCDKKTNPECVGVALAKDPAAILGPQLMAPEIDRMGMAMALGTMDVNATTWRGRSGPMNIAIWDSANRNSIEMGMGAFAPWTMGQMQSAVAQTNEFLNSDQIMQMMVQASTFSRQANIMRTLLGDLERTNNVLWNEVVDFGANNTTWGDTKEGQQWIAAQTSIITVVDTLAALISPNQAITNPAWDQAISLLRTTGGTKATLAALDVIQMDVNERIQAWHNVRPAIMNAQGINPVTGQVENTFEVWQEERQKFGLMFMEDHPDWAQMSAPPADFVNSTMTPEEQARASWKLPGIYDEVVAASERANKIVQEPVVGAQSLQFTIQTESGNHPNENEACQPGTPDCYGMMLSGETNQFNEYETFWTPSANQQLPDWMIREYGVDADW